MKTVQQLIEHLLRIENKSLPVKLEGCDCFGYWNGSSSISEAADNYGDALYLHRED